MGLLSTCRRDDLHPRTDLERWVDNTIGMRDLPGANYAASACSITTLETFDDDDRTYDDRLRGLQPRRLRAERSPLDLCGLKDPSPTHPTTSTPQPFQCGWSPDRGWRLATRHLQDHHEGTNPRLIGPGGQRFLFQFRWLSVGRNCNHLAGPVTYNLMWPEFAQGLATSSPVDSWPIVSLPLRLRRLSEVDRHCDSVHREALMYLVGNLSGVDPRLVAELLQDQEAMNSPVDPGSCSTRCQPSQRSRRTA